ncbi:MAG TPA: DUF3619 family protein [Burkholderiaceae bacterium]|nr:DUF3619 family protein [Burkholderiaceae bacterium]
MNDQQFAQQVRHLLDESAQRLPYRVQLRLQESRRQALARVPATAPAAIPPAAPGAVARDPEPRRPAPLVWRIASVAVPLLLVVVGLYGISVWKTDHDVVDLVEVDAALLTDDVPISAYADRGFGVFLRNTRQ